LLGAALLNQGAEWGLASVLIKDSINDYFPAAPTLCIFSYPQLQFLIRHDFDLE